MTEKITPENTDDIELLFANMDFDPKTLATGGMQVYSDFACDMESAYPGGIEFTPTRAVLASLHSDYYVNLMTRGLNGRPVFGALHESWAPGWRQGVRQSKSLGYLALNLAANAVLPEIGESTQEIAGLNHVMGGRVPTVLYGDHMESGELMDFARFEFQVSGAQLMPEVFRACGTDYSFEKVSQSFRRRSIGGVVLDTHHIQRSAEDDVDYKLDWKDVMGGIYRTDLPITGIHLSAGRIDTKQKHDEERSMLELAAWINGPEAMGRTAMGELLAMGVERWRLQQQTHKLEAEGRGEVVPDMKLPVTAEVPFAALKRYRSGKLKGRGHDFRQLHRQLANNAREFIDSI